jgi:peptidoglycan/xylan/chitin deacetylase (PgdA/CDA1 family)
MAARRSRLGHLLAVAVCCACGVSSAAAGGQQLTLGLRLHDASFSPNGDRRNDTLRGELVLSEPATVSVEVRSAAGKTVAVLLEDVDLAAGTARLRWNGASSDGVTVRDGSYTLAAKAVTQTPASVAARARVVVSTRAPRISWPSAGAVVLTTKRPRLPLLIGPDAASVQASLFVADQSATPVALLRTSWTSRRPAIPNADWGRRLLALEPGVYRLRAGAVDRAGNVGSAAPRSLIVRRVAPSRVVLRFRDVGRRLALTFDDCNSASAWLEILRTLEREHVTASFFCPGVAVAAHPELALRALRDHDVIGDHSWNHPSLDRLSPGALRAQFQRDQSLWWRLGRASPQPYFRPPYGFHAPNVLAAAGSMGYSLTVLWDVDPDDWMQPGSGVIVQRVLSRARPGSIVVLHVLPQTAAALPAILAGLRKRGLAPAGLDRLAQLDGLEPRLGLR